MSTLMDNGENAKVLLGVLAHVNRCMMTMRTSLDARPEVRTANRTCDVWITMIQWPTMNCTRTSSILIDTYVQHQR
jgi:hypothetical protein